MKHGDGSRPGAFFNTTGAIPAFFRIKDNGRLLPFRVRDHHIIRTNLHTEIASITNIGIEIRHPVRCRRIGYDIDFVTHWSLPPL
jgi:hypothetical protein